MGTLAKKEEDELEKTMVAQARNLLIQPQHSIVLQDGTIRRAHAGRKRAAIAL